MPFDLAADLLVVTLAIVSAVTDLKTGKVYNAVTFPALLLGMALATWAGGRQVGEMNLANSLFGLVIGSLACSFFYSRQMLGGGALKEVAAIGAIKGVLFVMMVFGIALAGAVLWLLGVTIYERLSSDPEATAREPGSVPYPTFICIAVLMARALGP